MPELLFRVLMVAWVSVVILSGSFQFGCVIARRWLTIVVYFVIEIFDSKEGLALNMNIML